jgi:hypothetical protein
VVVDHLPSRARKKHKRESRLNRVRLKRLTAPPRNPAPAAKKLADTCAAFQEQASAEQTKIRKAVEEIRDRLGAVKKLLREVG